MLIFTESTEHGTKLWNAITEDKVFKDCFDDITLPAHGTQKTAYAPCLFLRITCWSYHRVHLWDF